MGMTGKAVIGPGVIVADDQHNVRTRRRGAIVRNEPLPQDQLEKGNNGDKPNSKVITVNSHERIQ